MHGDWYVTMRQVEYWVNTGLPQSVAVLQAQWVRRQAIIRMHRMGMKQNEIAHTMGLSPGRIWEIILRTQSNKTSPVEAYLHRMGEWSKLRRGKNTMRIIDQLAGGLHKKADH